VCKNKGNNPNNWFGTVTLTGLNGNDIVGTFNVEYLNVPQMHQNAFRAEQPFFHPENLKKIKLTG
jgi:hypothetical protein